MFRRHSILLGLGLIFCACTEQIKEDALPEASQVVLIAVDPPEAYRHYLHQKKVGEQVEPSGPYSPRLAANFEYVNSLKQVQKWFPTPGQRDTLSIRLDEEYLELSTNSPFTTAPWTYLLRAGDTVKIEYRDQLPWLIVLNREVDSLELNYSRFRLQALFEDGYSDHSMVVLGPLFEEDNSDQEFERTSFLYFQEALNALEEERVLLDSLHQIGRISSEYRSYQEDVLQMVLRQHLQSQKGPQWYSLLNGISEEEGLESFTYDLSHTDSLFQFVSFRQYLNSISHYQIGLIEERGEDYGAVYTDSRARFDSILRDDRFETVARNFLLQESFKGILMDFKSDDKETYFQKLQHYSTDRQGIQELAKKHQLRFEQKSELLLISAQGDTLTLKALKKQLRGKPIYLDFWASWCKPCIELIPESKEMEEGYGSRLHFIYISMDGSQVAWENSLDKHNLNRIVHYRTLNSSTSQVLEELGIEAIPHYILLDEEGDIVLGKAPRPGQQARKEIEKQLTDL